MADSEIKNMIESEVKDLVAQHFINGETQKTNLEEENLVEIEQAVSTQFIYIFQIDGRAHSNHLLHFL